MWQMLLLQVLEDEVFPEASPALHNFVLAALLAPSHLGVPPPEAHSAKRLAIKAKVILPLPPPPLLPLLLQD